MSETAKMTYTCINDLEKKAKINFVGKEPRSVYKRLPDMKQKSETAKKEGDYETAYIMLKRWLDTVLWLKKTSDLKDSKSNYASKITLDQINEVKNSLADLTQKLEICYERNSKKHKDTIEKMEVEMDRVDTTETYASSTDIGLKLPETPTDDPLYGDSDEFISCNQLYNLVQKDSKYLIIDIREKIHYDNSKIISDKCINIPQSEIQLSKLALHFLKYLHKDKHSTDLFNHRSDQYVDIVILLDWHTTQESLTSTNSLNRLKDILQNWDPGTRYNKIKILNGGYQEWLIRYPPITTNSNVNIPEFNNIENESLVDQKIDYPELIDSDNEEEILKKMQSANQNKLNNTKAFNNMDIEIDKDDNNKSTSKHIRSNSNDIISSVKNFTSHVIIPIDGKRSSRSDITNAQRFENYLSKLKRKISSKMPQNEINARPVIDRSNKPPTLKTPDPRCKEVLKFMKELNELAKSQVKLANELLNQEFELYSQHEDKYNSSDVKYLQEEIKSLKIKLEDMVFIYVFNNLLD